VFAACRRGSIGGVSKEKYGKLGIQIKSRSEKRYTGGGSLSSVLWGVGMGRGSVYFLSDRKKGGEG